MRSIEHADVGKYADLDTAEDFEAAKAKALKIGAISCHVEDIRREFVEELCFPAIQANAIYENVYLLGSYNLPALPLHSLPPRPRPHLS